MIFPTWVNTLYIKYHMQFLGGRTLIVKASIYYYKAARNFILTAVSALTNS